MGRGQGQRSWKCCICGALLLLVVVVAVVLGVTLTQKQEQKQLKDTFIARCNRFSGYDCPKIWSEFEKAYVGKDPCNVSMNAYDDFIAAATGSPQCNKVMFWSKTKDLVHEFTHNGCFLTVENTMLGSVADGLTWCGKEGSSETFTSGCPGWTQCVNNPVRSFWTRSSEAFAEAACGNASVMLNGSLESPFSSESIFGSIEVKKLDASKVNSMTVVLITGDPSVATCSNPSLQELKTELKSIAYDCKEVTEEQIRKCAASSGTTCQKCW